MGLIGHFHCSPLIGYTMYHVERPHTGRVVPPMSSHSYHVHHFLFQLRWFCFDHQYLNNNRYRPSPVSSKHVLKMLFRWPTQQRFLQFSVNCMHAVTCCQLISHRYHMYFFGSYLRRIYFLSLPTSPMTSQSLGQLVRREPGHIGEQYLQRHLRIS